MMSRKFELNEAARKAKVDKTRRDMEAKELKQSRKKGKGPSPEVCEQYVALDCEMVGTGVSGRHSALAQCCITDWHGNTLYCSYVRPPERVTDFRTFVSGIRATHLKGADAVTLLECQKAVAAITKGRIIVGHALHNDLKALMLSHPKNMIRDTATYRPYKRPNRAGKLAPRSLKHLALEFLGREIQGGEHSPAEDAIAAMDLFKLKWAEWETSLKQGRVGKKAGASKPVRQIA
ncbi:ribonuclease H-like domain-containing protein [Tribonema minus]|uniref:RNA exonuclease 4 n=1 Tax=Tribonema minus TaxID=303371 RepID=A0A836CG98_9STRA|nr:ribonuclease H-like domain-containing protein [Tribonema minus]